MSARDTLSVTDLVRYGGKRPDSVVWEDRRYWRQVRLRNHQARRAEAAEKRDRLPILKMTVEEYDALLRNSKKYASGLWCDLSMSAVRRVSGYELRIKRDSLSSLLVLLDRTDVTGLDEIRNQAVQIKAALPEETKALVVADETMDGIIADLEGDVGAGVEDAALAARFLRKGLRAEGRVSVDLTKRQAQRMSKVLTACNIAPLCVRALNAF